METKTIMEAAAELDTGRRPATPEDKALGSRIRARRLHLRITQDQIAERLGKGTPKAVAHWESGHSRISAVDLFLLSKVLCCPVGYFAGEDEDTKRDPEWLGQIALALAAMPAGRLRELFKIRLREEAEREAQFLRLIAEEFPEVLNR